MDLTEAERLARECRERADAATAGPWWVDDDTVVVGPDGEPIAEGCCADHGEGACFHRGEFWADTRHRLLNRKAASIEPPR